MSGGFDDLTEADVKAPDLNADLEQLAVLRKADLRLKREAEDAHRAYLAKRAQVYERMEEENVASTRLPGVGLFVRNEPTWRPAIQDKRALLAWAQDNMPSLLRIEAAKSLLNQLVAERMRDGQELPPGLSAYPEKVVSVRKA